METQVPHLQNESTERTPGQLLTWMCIVVVLLHLYGAIVPNATTWGFHHIGFFSLFLNTVGFSLMVFFLSGNGQLYTIRLFQKISSLNIRLTPSSPVPYVLLASVGALMWLAREKLFFLGDGFLVVRNLSKVTTPEEVVFTYLNGPFAGWLVWKLFHLLSYLQISSADEKAFQLLSLLSGLGFFIVIAQIASLFTTARLDRLLLSVFIAGSGFVQLFFGYVELYAPALFCLSLYLLCAVLYLQDKTKILFPALSFGLLVSLHLGMLCLAPSLLYLLYHEFRCRRVLSSFLSGIASVLLFAALLLLSGYTPGTFWANIASTEKPRFLALTMTGNMYQPYPLFSLWHVVDYTNLLLLISPFTPILIIAFITKQGRTLFQRDRESTFLLITLLFGSGFAFSVNPDLGMSRDWDLMSTFIFPSVIFAAFAWGKQIEKNPPLRSAMGMMIGITLVHTGFWIALNSNDERALERIQVLPDKRFWSKGALGNAYEELAIYFRNRGDLPNALNYFDKYISEIPTNHRILISLGQLYIQLNDYDKAIEVTKRALELQPKAPMALNNMGAIIVNKNKNYADALPYFLLSIQYDSTLAEGYLNAGLCYQNLNDKVNMRSYWGKFLQLAPHAPQAAQVRQILLTEP